MTPRTLFEALMTITAVVLALLSFYIVLGYGGGY